MAISLVASLVFAPSGGQNGHFARGVPRFCASWAAKWPFRSKRPSHSPLAGGENGHFARGAPRFCPSLEGEMAISLEARFDLLSYYTTIVLYKPLLHHVKLLVPSLYYCINLFFSIIITSTSPTETANYIAILLYYYTTILL